MKKVLILTISTLLLSLFLINQVAYAFCEDSSDCPKGYVCVGAEALLGGDCVKQEVGLKDIKFPTSKILTVGEDDQKHGYFKKEGSPIVNFMLDIINFAVKVIGSIAMIILIIGGFMMMFAQGNQQKLDEAKDIVKYAFIGLIVTFLSYIIVIFVQSLFIPKSEQETTGDARVFHSYQIHQSKQIATNIQ